MDFQTSNHRKLSFCLPKVNRLVPCLRDRERTLVLLAAATGLRLSDFFGLEWGDVDSGKQVSVLRSIASQPVQNRSIAKRRSLDPRLVRTLRARRLREVYAASQDPWRAVLLAVKEAAA
jgi:integrase